MTKDQSELQSFAIIHTKLRPNQLNRVPMSRPRLLCPKKLKENEFKIIEVISPAGYGKSILLEQWQHDLQQQGVITAWLNIDTEDQDPIHFLEYLMALLEKISTHWVDRVKEAWKSGGFSSIKLLTNRLVYNIHQKKQNAVIFIEDVYLLKSSESYEILEYLIKHSPAYISWVISSREELPFSIEKENLSGLVKRFDYLDLAFNKNESIEFLQNYHKIDLSESKSEKLLQACEGWVAGLQLISMLLKDANLSQKYLEKLPVKHRNIKKFLNEVALQGQRQKLQDFLLGSAVTKRFCCESLSEILAIKHVHQLIEETEQKGLFLITLDEEGNWYRYHHMFGDFLQNYLKNHSPQKFKKISQKASLWFEKAGFTTEAIQYAFQAQDYERACALLSQIAFSLVNQKGDYHSLLYWAEKLPASYINRYPFIKIPFTMSLVYAGRFKEAEQNHFELKAFIEHINGSKEKKSEVEFSQLKASFDVMSSTLYLLWDRLEECQKYIDHWHEKYPESDRHHKALIYAVESFIHAYQFNHRTAQDCIENSLKIAKQVKSLFGFLWCLIHEIDLNLAQGKFKHILKLYRDSIKYITESFGKVPFETDSALSLVMSRVHYERGEFEQVEKFILECNELTPKILSVTDYHYYGYSTLALHSLWKQDIPKAFNYLDEGIKLGKDREQWRLVQWLYLEKALLSIRLGQISHSKKNIFEMQDVLKKENHRSGPIFTLMNEYLQLAQFRFDIASSKKDIDLNPIDQWIKKVKKQGRYHLYLRLLIYQSIAYLNLGKEFLALKILKQALSFASKEKIIMLFVEEGPLLYSLLEKIMSEHIRQPNFSIPNEFIHKIMSLTLQNPLYIKRIHEDNNTREAQKLTKRESEILKKLNSDYRQEEIAKQLFISVATLRFYLRNIYQKLQVHNHSGAIARAKHLGLFHEESNEQAINI